MYQPKKPIEKTLTGTRLRSYAFALLARREYSKQELNDKLNLYALNPDEVRLLVDELADSFYQSDQRVAETVLSSQIRQGKGIHRIKQQLQKKGLNPELIEHDLDDVDWLQHAYQLKLKKFGHDITKDPKQKAKQIRFLQYRGFSMDVILKAIHHQIDEDE